MDDRFRDEYEMSEFLLTMIKRVPIGSIWYIVEYLDDIWNDFPDFQEVKSFLIKDSSRDNKSSLLKICIDEDFINWFKSFRKKNYIFCGYLERHGIAFEDRVYFVQIESTNIHLNKHLELNESEIKEIASIGNYIAIEDDISTNDIFFFPVAPNTISSKG